MITNQIPKLLTFWREWFLHHGQKRWQKTPSFHTKPPWLLFMCTRSEDFCGNIHFGGKIRCWNMFMAYFVLNNSAFKDICWSFRGSSYRFKFLGEKQDALRILMIWVVGFVRTCLVLLSPPNMNHNWSISGLYIYFCSWYFRKKIGHKTPPDGFFVKCSSLFKEKKTSICFFLQRWRHFPVALRFQLGLAYKVFHLTPEMVSFTPKITEAFCRCSSTVRGAEVPPIDAPWTCGMRRMRRAAPGEGWNW